MAGSRHGSTVVARANAPHRFGDHRLQQQQQQGSFRTTSRHSSTHSPSPINPPSSPRGGRSSGSESAPEASTSAAAAASGRAYVLSPPPATIEGVDSRRSFAQNLRLVSPSAPPSFLPTVLGGNSYQGFSFDVPSYSYSYGSEQQDWRPPTLAAGGAYDPLGTARIDPSPSQQFAAARSHSSNLPFAPHIPSSFSPLPRPNTGGPFADGGEFLYDSYHGLTEEQQAQEDADAAEQAEGGIIADQEDWASDDGGYESDNASTGSESLSSSVWDFSFENGRRYHKFREGRYNFPNDDSEQEREDMKHAMVKMLCQDQLHFAPIGDTPQEILDLGTGTGAWAIEMGEAFPSASVLGIDLSPIQPDWVPPNVKFMVDDVESSWDGLHPTNHYDLIHSRHMVMGIKDWESLLRTGYEHLKPGGWFELQEICHFPMSSNGTPLHHNPVFEYWRDIGAGLTELGINLGLADNGQMAELMRGCGYVNVTERVFHVPIGTWPKNRKLKSVGLSWKTILLDGAQAIALGPLTRGLHWSREQVEVGLIDVRNAYQDTSCQMFMPFVCVYGQKPGPGS